MYSFILVTYSKWMATGVNRNSDYVVVPDNFAVKKKKLTYLRFSMDFFLQRFFVVVFFFFFLRE